MEHSYEELKKKTVVELREIAAGIDDEAVKGHSQLNKEHLLVALCKALKIDTHAHRRVVGLNKAEVKAKIRSYKQKLEEAIKSKNHEQVERYRHSIHCLKRQIHKAMK